MDAIETSSTAPTQDERVMAALAQVSIILPFFGVVVPIFIWVTQKDKSKFVSFQSLQAVAFQLTLILFYFGGMPCYMCSFFGMFLGTIPLSATENPNPLAIGLFGLSFAFPFVIFAGLFVGMFVFIIYGIVATVMVVQGKDFRYVLLGNRLERYLQQGK